MAYASVCSSGCLGSVRQQEGSQPFWACSWAAARRLRAAASVNPPSFRRAPASASAAAGGVGEATLPRLLERREPAQQHLSGIEYGRGFRRADHAAANRAREQLNLDLPTCCPLGAC